MIEIDALAQRKAQALCDAALDLTRNGVRVNRSPDLLAHHVALHRDLPGDRVDADFGLVEVIGGRRPPFNQHAGRAHGIVRRRWSDIRSACRYRSLRPCGCLGDLAECEARGRNTGNRHDTICDHQVLGSRLEHLRRPVKHLAPDIRGGVGDSAADHVGGATALGPSVVAGGVGVGHRDQHLIGC